LRVGILRCSQTGMSFCCPGAMAAMALTTEYRWLNCRSASVQSRSRRYSLVVS
jgi:hypothetical protein